MGVINKTVGLEFGADWKSKLEALWTEEKLKMYGEDGLPIDVKPRGQVIIRSPTPRKKRRDNMPTFV